MVNHKSILALIAVAALGSAIATTDASARGFGGGGFGGGGGHSFGGMSGRSFGGGGQLGGNSLRQVSLSPGLRSPAGGLHVPSGAGLPSVHSGSTIQAPAGGFHVPSSAGLKPIHPGATIRAADKPVPVPQTPPPTTAPPSQTPPPARTTTPSVPETPEIIDPGKPITIHLPPGGLPSLPGARFPITDPHGGGLLPPHAGVIQPNLPKLPPLHPIDPTVPPHAGNPSPPPHPANPSPPDYPPVGGGYNGPTISVGIVGPDVGDALAVISDTTVVVAGSYTPVSGPTCDRLLRNGCYLAMRKYSAPNGGTELRCTMICE